MKAIAENLYVRGKSNRTYCRVRIPQAILSAYPKQQTRMTRSLDASDVCVAKKHLGTELTFIEAEVERAQKAIHGLKQARFVLKRLTSTTDEELQMFACHWVHQALLSDDLDK